MMGWLRKIFGSKAKEEQKEEPKKITEQEIQEAMKDVPEREVVEDEAKTSPEMRPERKEKHCPKCGAPNDDFVDVCWMCKERIY